MKNQQRTAVVLVALLVVPIMLIAANLVIETGPSRCEDFEMTTGAGVTVSDSTSGWSQATSCLIDATDSVTDVQVELFLASGPTTLTFNGGTATTLPVKFEAMPNITTATSFADTVAKSVLGSFRLYLLGD